MGITTKFNIALLLVSALGLAAAGWLSHRLLQDNARDEVLLQAGIMMETAAAIRAYTVDEIRPLLTMQMKRQFLPQTVPAYAATKNIRGMRESYAEYTYKEAALNPTNPADRATDWEADIVEYFRNNPDATEVVGQRTAARGEALYMARPIRINDETCLACHGTPAEAPETLLARYGDSNGFGWQMDEVIGAQVVSVPMSVPMARADRAFRTLMIGLAAVFLAVMLVVNLLLYFIVIRPVNRMAAIADQVSRGDEGAPPFATKGRDQIASLGRSFNRMRLSLGSAMEMLEQTMGEGGTRL